jgi:Na+/H+ antiporter NhaD/arsenite permease-like protein
MDYQPTPWMMLPFGLLLGTIAVGPLLFARWWVRHYAKVALGLGLISVLYYCFGLPAAARQTVVHTAGEYLSFIALIGSLYVVSGGIHILVKGEATPSVNVAFLLIGAILSNVLGTTGASMLLIRPWLRMNKYRVTAHHVVFFIFIVSNVGGCLTPIGDPPLFLGYLKGIPFWWVAEHCWPMWAVGLIVLLLMFFVIDYRNYRRAPQRVRAQLAEPGDEWRFEGLGNVVFLGMILGAVFLTEPRFLREVLMIGAALGSYFTTRKTIHRANHFNFHPIREVAILFIGIFATMMPALDWLQLHAGKLGHPSAGFFYFSSGTLSSLLDNAPTYLSFLSVILGSSADPAVVKQVHHLIQNGGLDLAQAAEPVRQTYEALRIYYAAHFSAKTIGLDQIEMAYVLANAKLTKYLVAISIAAVFFGASTYIGNAPNFMVKFIADQQRVHTPGFIGYLVRFTLPFMVPMLVLVWCLFFRQ